VPARLLAALALAALPGCSRPAPPAVRGSDYYPLEVGLVWSYRGGEHNRTVRVARHEVLDGTPCARVETRQDDEVVATEHVFTRADGVYGLSRDGKKLSRPLLLLKLPPAAGSTWQETFLIDGRRRQATYRIGKAETVEVPLGRYEAVPLQGEILEGGARVTAFTYWFARDVGMVKQAFKSPGQTVTYELEKMERPR
jgi:hypothetical protein